MTHISLEQKVMASVAAIYFTRSLISLPALKVYALILSVWGIGRLVWVSKIFENFFALNNMGAEALLTFLLAAFGHTQLLVQVGVVVALIAGLSLFVDFVRASSRRFAL